MIYLILAGGVLISVIAIYIAGRSSGETSVKKDIAESTVKAMETRNEVEDDINILSLDERRKRLLDSID